MSAEQVAEIDGHPVYMMEIALDDKILSYLERISVRRLCPLCSTGWKNHVPTRAKSLLSNHKLFPNCMVHQGCIDHAGGMQAASEQLKVMYDECKAAQEKFIPLGWIQSNNGGYCYD